MPVWSCVVAAWPAGNSWLTTWPSSPPPTGNGIGRSVRCDRGRQPARPVSGNCLRCRHFREAMRAQSARRHTPQLSEEAQWRLAGAAFVVIGIGIAYVRWGTWWLALAAAMLIVGLISLFGPAEL